MDVIYYLAKGLGRLAYWLGWLLVAAISRALGRPQRTSTNKAQASPVNQGENVAPPQPPQVPEIHVHVHLDDKAHQASPASGGHHPTASAPSASIAVLSRADHGIYITTGSQLMEPHPRADELLEQLDYMLYVSAHRDGDPFSLTVPLDTSRNAARESLQLLPLASVDEGDFLDVPPKMLPSPDGALWMLRPGEPPRRLPVA